MSYSEPKVDFPNRNFYFYGLFEKKRLFDVQIGFDYDLRAERPYYIKKSKARGTIRTIFRISILLQHRVSVKVGIQSEPFHFVVIGGLY